MGWIQENWEIIAAVLGIAVAILKHLGQARYAKVVTALIQAIEETDAVTTKKVATVKTTLNGTQSLLAVLVKQLTKGGGS